MAYTFRLFFQNQYTENRQRNQSPQEEPTVSLARKSSAGIMNHVSSLLEPSIEFNVVNGIGAFYNPTCANR
jgi:hypothetical protein